LDSCRRNKITTPREKPTTPATTTMEVLQAYVDQARVATAHDAVYNTECCYTFFNDDLLVNLHTFAGTTAAFATPDSINVRIVRVRREKPKDNEEALAAPTKLAIGVEGGFDVEKYETVTTYSVVVVGNDPRSGGGGAGSSSPFAVELPYTDETTPSFPEKIQQSVESIIRHAGVGLQQQVQAWQADDDEIPVSKYAKATTLPSRLIPIQAIGSAKRRERRKTCG
jgi:hypothetical protein